MRAHPPALPPVSWFNKRVFAPLTRVHWGSVGAAVLTGAGTAIQAASAVAADPVVGTMLPRGSGAVIAVAGLVLQAVTKPVTALKTPAAPADAAPADAAPAPTDGDAVNAAMTPPLPSVADTPHLTAADLTP